MKIYTDFGEAFCPKCNQKEFVKAKTKIGAPILGMYECSQCGAWVTDEELEMAQNEKRLKIQIRQKEEALKLLEHKLDLKYGRIKLLSDSLKTEIGLIENMKLR